MKTIIIDDERLARQELKNMLIPFDEIEVIGEAANADEAIEMIQQSNPDLIFLDVQMPGKDGFEMLQELNSVPTVVFVTAYDEYALKAFEVNAMDYLVKPVQPERLKESIRKLLEEFDKKSRTKTGKIARNNLTGEDQVFVKDGDKCWFVKLSDIRMFESDGNYVKVYFHNFRPLIHKSLNALEEKLDGNEFFRASRKYIINLKWVENIESWFNGGLMVHLKGGDKLEISRRQAVKFKEMMSL
ncbi:response regulator transcription factor [Hyphobacterium sp. CCMP332]|nr:response regulator transcription factor [Hyphobacterium sp. CCMP332]